MVRQPSLGANILICASLSFIACLPARADLLDSYRQQNLVSDLPGQAARLDPNLVNPWGIAFSATSPIWLADNGTGLSTLYNGSGGKIPLVVTIPPPSGGSPPSAPTGVVFNPGASFDGDKFIFATEDGTIAGWSGGTTAALRVDNSGSGAVYKALALGSTAGGNLIYAANFNSGNIDVFNANYGPTSVSGSFTDPNLPAGYAPFDIQNIDGKLYVTYAVQDAAKHDDVAGPGNGLVDVFDLNGNLLQRLVSNGPLDSPWGLALAPSGFGAFSGDLLVGNFGNGLINAFDPSTGAFKGVLDDANGTPIEIPGLWGLAFGNGSQGTKSNDLYFTAGIPGPGKVEDHGLFGDLETAPEPTSIVLFGTALLTCAFFVRRRRRNQSS